MLKTLKMDGFWGNLIAGLIVWMTGIIFERWLGISYVPQKIINKIIQKMPQKIRQKVFAVGWNVNVTQSATQEGSEADLGTKEKALGAPDIPLDTRNDKNSQSFIFISISELLANETDRLILKSDYEQAWYWINNNDSRAAATIFVRAYGPIINVLQNRGYKNCANKLKKETLKLSTFGKEGVESESINTTLSNIDRIFHEHFQQNR